MVRKLGNNSNLTSALVTPRVETTATDSKTTIKAAPTAAAIRANDFVPNYLPQGTPTSRIFKRLSTIRDAGAETPASATLQESVRALFETSSAKWSRAFPSVGTDISKAVAIATSHLQEHLRERDATIHEFIMTDGTSAAQSATTAREQLAGLRDAMRGFIGNHMADRAETFANFRAAK